MPRQLPSVTHGQASPDLLPTWLTMPAVLFQRFSEQDVVVDFAERLRVERKAGGHGSLGAIALLVALFASEVKCGIRPFWNRMKDWDRANRDKLGVAKRLASLLGRTKMCSPASLSRFLNAVDVNVVRPSYEWLLVDVPELLPLLTHPSMVARDAQGSPWHIFDFDPSVKAFRERDLEPGDEEMPAGHRRTGDIAKPGYAGRKRGETQYVRAVVAHAGSGAWTYSQLTPGNGDARGDLTAGLDAIGSLVDRMEVQREHVLVRVDGAYGNVPAMTSLLERGLSFVTRAAQKIVHLPDVQARLSKAQWVFVSDRSKSVAELGWMVLEPSERTRKDDGTPFEPVKVRAVVSRLPKSGKAGRGVVIDDFQYEVFLTTLQEDAWPAVDVVSSYHARSTCENRFGQEDRELQLDRTFSFHPDGQELATVIGMMVWNLKIVLGFRDTPPPEVAPTQPARDDRVDDRPCTFPPQDPPPPPPPAETVPAPAPSPAGEVHNELAEALQQLPWDQMLAGREGYAWQPSLGLTCPDGQAMHLVSVRVEDRAEGSAAVYFATRRGACRDCSLLGVCLQSTSGKTTKQMGVTVSEDQGKRLKSILERLPRRRRPRSPQIARRAKKPPSRPRGGHVLLPAEPPAEPGPWVWLPALFLPSEARKQFSSLARSVQVEIGIDVPPKPVDDPHPLVALDRRARRHGRQSWTQRDARYRLAHGTTVTLHIRADRTTAQRLAGRRTKRRSGDDGPALDRLSLG